MAWGLADGNASDELGGMLSRKRAHPSVLRVDASCGEAGPCVSLCLSFEGCRPVSHRRCATSYSWLLMMPSPAWGWLLTGFEVHFLTDG